MEEKQEPPRKMYPVKCSRCTVVVELAQPLKTTGMLCNPCWMKWKEIEGKMIGHAYQDEVNAAFIKFVNSLAFLKNHTI